MAKGLFFGFFIDSFYKKSLQEVADPLKKLYIQEEAGSYLQLFQFQEKSYLGKFLDDQVDLRSLELTFKTTCAKLSLLRGKNGIIYSFSLGFFGFTVDFYFY